MATTYYASVQESAAGANKRHLAVWNGVGSGKTMVVYRIVAAPAPTAAVTGGVIPLVTARLTAKPTTGTGLAWAKAKVTNPAPPVLIEVAGNVGGGSTEAIAFGVGAVSGEETVASTESVIYQAPLDGSEAIEFGEGSGFEVRQLTLASAGAVNIVAVIGLV